MMHGPVDLTNCDREPIHLLGAIQPLGYLIAVSADWMVSFVSANVKGLLGEGPDAVIGSPLTRYLSRELVHSLRNAVQNLVTEDASERIAGAAVGDEGATFDVTVHLSGSNIIVEFEAAEAHPAAAGHLTTVRSAIVRLRTYNEFKGLAGYAAQFVRLFTGFDRVMVYRFLPDGAGEVVAEARQSNLEPFLGLRYPASDIPSQARELYTRNPIRTIADINAEPVPLVPSKSPTGHPLDLSHSVLRSVSPIHIEYLQNMGVGASMSVSLIKDGTLWGLIACHHMSPKSVPGSVRHACDLFAQMFSLCIDNLERAARVADEERASRVHTLVLSTVARHGSEIGELAKLAPTFRDFIRCDGLAICVDGEVHTDGQTPDPDEIGGVVQFLNRAAASQILSLDDIGSVYPEGREFASRAAGLLAIPISRTPRDYLIFFRREIPQVVKWAGKPEKDVAYGPNGPRLTPRKSFEAYQESVRGKCEAWGERELVLAQSLRTTLLEVVLRLADAAEEEHLRARQKQELLVSELNHRVRNLLSLVQSIIGQTRDSADTIGAYVDILNARIKSLGRAHNQITNLNWNPGSVRELVETESAAYLVDKGERIKVEGPDIYVQPVAFSILALIVHELMTNASKYGALCDRHGSVAVELELTSQGDLVMYWRETGGPPVTAPTRRGFGSTIIEKTLPHDLDGEASVEYASEGVRARFRVPAKFVDREPIGLRQVAISAKDTRPAMAQMEHLPNRVLVVEDNVLVAMTTQALFEEIGVREVEIVSNVNSALAIIENKPPDFALLDVNLGDENSFPVADKLRELGVPMVFASGYGDNVIFPDDHADTPRITKPFDLDAITALFPNGSDAS